MNIKTVVVTAFLAVPLVTAGCTLAELKEFGGFAADSAVEAAKNVDPVTLLTGQGIATAVGIFVTGLATRELGTLGRKGAGPLMRLLARLFKKGS